MPVVSVDHTVHCAHDDYGCTHDVQVAKFLMDEPELDGSVARNWLHHRWRLATALESGRAKVVIFVLVIAGVFLVGLDVNNQVFYLPPPPPLLPVFLTPPPLTVSYLT